MPLTILGSPPMSFAAELQNYFIYRLYEKAKMQRKVRFLCSTYDYLRFSGR